MIDKLQEKASNIKTNPFLSGIDPEVPDSNTDIEPTRDEFFQKIQQISQSVIQAMEQESLPCLPANYELYFGKFLEKEPPSTKEKVRKIMNLQSDIQNRALVFEKSVGESLKIIKQVLNCMSVVYQNFIISQNVVKRYSKDMSQADNKLVFKNVMDFFMRDINKVTNITFKQLGQIQNLYTKINRNLKSISQNSVYDLTLDVYNKNYFTSFLQKEQELCKEFNHSSILIYVSLSRSIASSVGQDSPTFLLLLKTMAKFLQKHIRSSDAVAYMGNGIFGVLLKYSDVLEAQELCISLYQASQTTDIFVADINLQLDIITSITKILPDRSIEETMSACLSTLRIALEEKQRCKIYQQDEVSAPQ